MLSWYVARARKSFNAVRHNRILARLPHSRRSLSFVLVLLLTLVCTLLYRLTPHFSILRGSLRPHVRSSYSRYSSSSSSAALQLALPAIDPDRPATLRRHYEDALTLHADHSAVFKPLHYAGWTWDTVSQQPEQWQAADMPQRVQRQIATLTSSSTPALYRRAILQSLLEYQFHADSPGCATNTRYLLYSFSGEFASVNTACMSSRTLAALYKAAHVSANKVLSVREIMEQLEKANQRRKEKAANLQPPPETSSIEELADDCKLAVLLDVVRALFIAQASRRELVLLPVSSAVCDSAKAEVGAELSSAQWMGCVWRDLFVRPSTCAWSDVSRLVDEFGYHEDPFYDLADSSVQPSTPVAIYRSMQHCHNDEDVWQHMHDTLQPFLRWFDSSAIYSHVSRLLLFQTLTRFLLTPSSLLQQHITSTQQQLVASTQQDQSSASSSLSSSLPPLLFYYAHYRAAKEPVTLNASAHLPLVSSLLSHHTASSGVRDVLMWLEGEYPTATFMPQLQSQLPHLRLYHLSASSASDVLSGYIAAISKLFLVANSGGGKLMGYSSVVGRLLRQLEDDGTADGASGAGGVLDTDGDEWFDDCDMFSWHFYRAHTTDLPVQRPEASINALIYPALAAPTSLTPNLPPLPPVQLLIMIGVSAKELTPFSTMFDALSCDGDDTRPFKVNDNLTVLLQKLFNSPQTVDEYAALRVQFQNQLQAEVQRLHSSPQPSSSTTISPVIRVDFIPWNVDRPFRAVLKADVALLGRFIRSLATFLPVQLRLLLATREPPNVIYAGTKSPLKELPSTLEESWRYFFVARVLRDHLTALSGELRALDASVYHVVDMDDIVLRTAHHTKQMAAFLSRPQCALPMYRFLRQTQSPLVNLTASDLPNLSAAEAAGALDITTNLRYHGFFERSPSAAYTMDALTNDLKYENARASAVAKPILTPDEWLVGGEEVVSRQVDRGLLLHVAGHSVVPWLNTSVRSVPPLAVAGSAASTQFDPVTEAITVLQAPAAKTCPSRRFLVFDLFLRSVPCSCSSTTQPTHTDSWEDPAIAEAIRAVGRTLSLAVSSGRTLVVPQMSSDSSDPSSFSSLSYLSYLSATLQPLTACTLEAAGLQLSCHCPTHAWHIKPVGEGDASVEELDAVYSDSSVVLGHASDFHFGWLLHYNRVSPLSTVSAYQYISSLHTYIITSIARNEDVLSFLSSYRSSLSSSSSFQASAPALAFSLPRSDLYTVRTYVGLITRQLDVYGLSQLYITTSCSLLYQHQHEDTGTGSRPPSCEQLTETARAIAQQLKAAHDTHKHFHPSTTKQLNVRLSPRLELDKHSTATDWVHATLADIWLVAHSSRIMSTQASEEGLLIAELAYEQLMHDKRKHGRGAFSASSVRPVWSHVAGRHAGLHQPTHTRSRPEGTPLALLGSLCFHPFVRSARRTYIVPLCSACRRSAVHPPAIRKTIFSSDIRFIFIAGIEGAGHHFMEVSLGGTLIYSPWNPIGRANITRIKVEVRRRGTLRGRAAQRSGCAGRWRQDRWRGEERQCVPGLRVAPSLPSGPATSLDWCTSCSCTTASRRTSTPATGCSRGCVHS